MDQRTLSYYDLHASDVAARYDAIASPLARQMASAFPVGCRVLDIGSGSGRDVAHLLGMGVDAFGVEPVQAMREQAIRRYPQLAVRLADGALPALGQPFGGQFDGVLCSAVLMHVPEATLFDSALAIKAVLRANGRLLISLPDERPGLDAEGRDTHGRLFGVTTPAALQLLFERLGFQVLDRLKQSDGLGRHDIRWTTLLMTLRDSASVRPVDQIEAVLNRDRKVATYKLALFRALAELATQEPRIVRWRADDTVSVPLRRIAEKWVGYYWPIVASPRLFPQIQGEGRPGAKSLKFRQPLLALMAPYAGQGPHGGLASWTLDLNSGCLGAAARRELESTLTSIEQALRDGPIVHSGAELDTGRVFSYDKHERSVVMDAGLWRELSLLGHWIADAVILRWAELSERFGRAEGIDAGMILPLLLAKPDSERSTAAAREIFQRTPALRCTWTGRLIGDRLAVDHAIPFSLWGTNDLWNLLPTLDTVNAKKSDLLPSGDLLSRRRTAIIDSWECLRNQLPDVFDRQAIHLLGAPHGGDGEWRDLLFARLREMIEITALQRGVRRWLP